MTKNKPEPDMTADADYWKARCEEAERMIKALTAGKRELDMRRAGTAPPPDPSSTVVLHNYRTYGPNLDANTIMMAHRGIQSNPITAAPPARKTAMGCSDFAAPSRK